METKEAPAKPDPKKKATADLIEATRAHQDAQMTAAEARRCAREARAVLDKAAAAARQLGLRGLKRHGDELWVIVHGKKSTTCRPQMVEEV